MNEEVITSPKIPRRFRITKIFLYIVLIAAFCKTLRGITGTVYCIVSPKSSFHVTLTDSGRCYMKHGLGFDRVPLEYLALSEDDFPIENERLFIGSFQLLITLTDFLPVFLILIQACRLLKAISSSYTPFTEKTTKLIHSIGMIMLLKGALGKLILQVLMTRINFHRLGFVNPYDLNWIVTGLLVLILSDVFYKGCLLQQDADETL